MGVTGIGKTALVKLLSSIMDYQFITLDVHAGITKEQILEKIQLAEQFIKIEKKTKLVLFFDEINTNKNISGLLKEILLDRRVEGNSISKNILLLAACNPYKLKKNNAQTHTIGIK